MNQADAIGSLQDVLEGELTLRGGLPGKTLHLHVTMHLQGTMHL